MHPPLKDQTTLDVDNPTIDASDRPGNKDVTQQQFAKETDTNYLLSRWGLEPERGKPQYGEWDDSYDLQTTLEATREAEAAFARLPDGLKAKFDTIQDLVAAVEHGKLILRDGEPPPDNVPPVDKTTTA